MRDLKSFLIAGFECSTHRLNNGKRLDLIASSYHDKFILEDYIRMKDLGFLTAREGLRWHLIEKSSGNYDFSSVLPFLEAAKKCGIVIIWDLLHYGWPDDIDIYSDDFVVRFENFTEAFASFYFENTTEDLHVCPINEISFFAWGGGDTAYINPFSEGRGDELKKLLVRSAIRASDLLKRKFPRTWLVQIDPIINIAPNPELPERIAGIAGYNQAQYAAWDMLTGKLAPELGGKESFIDIVGVNYYPRNQWVDHGQRLNPGDPEYIPFRTLLSNVYQRFNKPIIIAETGTEDDERPAWFRYIAEEAYAAIKEGTPIQGICLYPILNHPGWDDDRHCHNGLWDYADANGHRELYVPLATEVEKWRKVFDSMEEVKALSHGK